MISDKRRRVATGRKGEEDSIKYSEKRFRRGTKDNQGEVVRR